MLRHSTPIAIVTRIMGLLVFIAGAVITVMLCRDGFQLIDLLGVAGGFLFGYILYILGEILKQLDTVNFQLYYNANAEQVIPVNPPSADFITPIANTDDEEDEFEKPRKKRKRHEDAPEEPLRSVPQNSSAVLPGARQRAAVEEAPSARPVAAEAPRREPEPFVVPLRPVQPLQAEEKPAPASPIPPVQVPKEHPVEKRAAQETPAPEKPASPRETAAPNTPEPSLSSQNDKLLPMDMSGLWQAKSSQYLYVFVNNEANTQKVFIGFTNRVLPFNEFIKNASKSDALRCEVLSLDGADIQVRNLTSGKQFRFSFDPADPERVEQWFPDSAEPVQYHRYK